MWTMYCLIHIIREYGQHARTVIGQCSGAGLSKLEQHWNIFSKFLYEWKKQACFINSPNTDDSTVMNQNISAAKGS